MKITIASLKAIILNIIILIIALFLMHDAVKDNSYVIGIISIFVACISFNDNN